MNKIEFKLGELFCGPGGLGLGARLSKVVKNNTSFSIKHIWATDNDEQACQTYRKNILVSGSDRVKCADIRTLDYNDLGSIDALTFGFPCNDFSSVGERKGINGKFGPLYTYGVKALEHFKPKWFLAENVGGLRSSNNGFALSTILMELKNAGYKIVSHLYKFEEYNVPQTRHRIIIVGIRNDIDVEYFIPKPTGNEFITSREAIEVPPIDINSPNHVFTNQSRTVIERLSHIKPGENAFTADLPVELRLNVKSVTISQIYKRLNPNKPSYTVTGSGGGGTHVYHWRENRALTNRERARLQTFPDSFVFQGSKERVRRQIGMAVPPVVAKIIFRSILKSFAGVKYPFVKPNIT